MIRSIFLFGFGLIFSSIYGQEQIRKEINVRKKVKGDFVTKIRLTNITNDTIFISNFNFPYSKSLLFDSSDINSQDELVKDYHIDDLKMSVFLFLPPYKSVRIKILSKENKLNFTLRQFSKSSGVGQKTIMSGKVPMLQFGIYELESFFLDPRLRYSTQTAERCYKLSTLTKVISTPSASRATSTNVLNKRVLFSVEFCDSSI